MSLPVTQHFGVAEFACRDGSSYPAEWIPDRLLPLCETLEAVRLAAGNLPLTVDSGYRTEAYNRRVGGQEHSQHKLGRAADVVHAKLSPMQLFNLVLRLYEEGKLPLLGGVGLYPGFVHLDVRARPGAVGPNGGHLAIWGGTRPSNVA